jgi:hypothetical protein
MPFSSSIFTIALCPFFVAHDSDVRLSLSLGFSLAPYLSSLFTTSLYSFLIAYNSDIRL